MVSSNAERANEQLGFMSLILQRRFRRIKIFSTLISKAPQLEILQSVILPLTKLSVKSL